MTQVSVGDLAQSHMLRRQTTATKTEIQRLSQEVTTGQVADTAARLSGNLAPVSAIDASLARLDAYGSVTKESAVFASAMQSGLGVISELASQTAQALLTATGTSATGQIDGVAGEAAQALGSVMSTLNTRFGDRTLFAGVATSGPAVIGAEALITSLQTLVAGASSVSDVQTALDGWFDAPSGFAATAYLGGPAMGDLPIAPGEEVSLDVTATDPALRATIKGLAMANLLDRGLFANQPTLRHALAQKAGESLSASASDRAYTAARLGSAEARIDAAATRNTAESSSLGIARTALLEVDPYEAATRLQNAESQLDLIYALTARLSRLSLADYI